MLVVIRFMVDFADAIGIPLMFRAEVPVTKHAGTQRTDGLEIAMLSGVTVAHSFADEAFVSIHDGCCRVGKEQTIDMRLL